MTHTWNILPRCAGGLIPILTALGAVACTGPADRSDEAGDSATLDAQWTHVAPGVWKRALPEGGYERMGVGLAGLRSDIAAAEERQAAFEQRSSAPEDATEIQANTQLLADLRSILAEVAGPNAGAEGDEAQPPMPPPAEDGQFGQEGYPYGPISTGVSGNLCNGAYHLEVTLTNQWHNHYVDVSASWSEFGPFPTFVKHMSTYAWALGGNGIPMSDSDQKSFTGSCCEYLSSSAAAGVTFTPQLYGAAYLGVDTGCYGTAFHSYSRGL